jgi:hypothetical protein
MATAKLLIQRVTNHEMQKLTARRQRMTSLMERQSGGERG